MPFANHSSRAAWLLEDFREKSYFVSRFCRHPGRCLRHDLLGQRVRSNHTVHTGGSSDAADSADAGHTAYATDAADSACADAGSSACFAAAAFFGDANALDPGSFFADSGRGADA